MKAIWNDVVLAESDDIVTLEGNMYFPPESVNREDLRPSEHSTTCPWKGTASYANVSVNGDVNENAAWFYPEPKDAASHIKDHVAFWKGVSVEK